MSDGVSFFKVLELIIMLMTIGSVVGSAVWGVATMRQMTVQLGASVKNLTTSVDKLADRIDELEHEHAAVRERLARLEGPTE